MVIKATIQMDAGSGVRASYETEVVVDSQEEAEEAGETFAMLAMTFGNGFGKANLE